MKRSTLLPCGLMDFLKRLARADQALQARHVLVKDLAKAAQAMRMSVEHLDRPGNDLENA